MLARYITTPEPSGPRLFRALSPENTLARYYALVAPILISVNSSLFALHIGQTYGGSSRKTTYPHCLQYHSLFLISEVPSSVIWLITVCEEVLDIASLALVCLSLGLLSGIDAIGFLPSNESLFTYSAQ